MKPFTKSPKYLVMLKKTLISLFMLLTISFGQSIAFTPAGQTSSFTKYNLTVSTASSVDGTGGFSLSGSGFSASTNYYIKVSFDGGSNWYALTDGTATVGVFLGSGLFTTDSNGDIQVAFQHTRFTGLAAWPGNNGTITLRASTITSDTYYPGASGSDYTLDLTRPTISTSSITSNNSTNSTYATTGDQVSITFNSSENLSNSDYPFTGNISGVSYTASGSGTSWTASNTVSTHAEGTATFAISFYDENGNLGSSSLSTTTDASSVTIDKTNPTLTVSIASNNSTSTLAKIDDIVTVTINSDEILNTAPTVSIDGNSITPNPNTAASSYAAVRTMASGDTQGPVSIAISNIVDRAGNSATDISETTDATSVVFDSNNPSITGLTISSDNALNSSYAKPDDWVTITFYTSEASQTPTATILTEATTESNSSGDQLSWLATKQMDADDTDGTVTFTIDYFDLAGNQGAQKISIMSGTDVTFDGTVPTVNSVTVVSSNADDTYAKEGDVISATIVTDEALSSISSATIAGQSITGSSISEISSTNWKLSYTVTGSESSGSVSYAFTVIDEAGNETSTTSAGSVVVIDNTSPSLTTVEILSDNAANTSYAKEGDVVTLTIASNEDLIAAPTVFLAGRAATVSAVGGSATNYTATLTMNSTDTQGTMDISIAFTDLSGNAGTIVTSTTNSSSVLYDRQVPTLSAVTVSTNNSNSLYAKEGDIITLSFTSSENLTSSPIVTIGGNAATESGSDASWTATYLMVNGDNEGSVTFTVDFTDIAGNVGTQVTSLTSGSLIVYDESVPTLSTVDLTSNNAEDANFSTIGDVITLSITASENIQTPTIGIVGSAATIASGNNGESVFTATYTMQSSDATTTDISFTVDFQDLSSNAGTQVIALVNDADGGVSFDKEAPSFTAVNGGTVSILSNNSESTLAKVGDIITVSLTSSEALMTGSDPTVTIAGNTATVTRNSTTSFTAVYTMSSSDAAYDGLSIPINISNYSDPTGNAGLAVTATTDGTSVLYDKSTPSLSTVSISSNNTNSHYAKEDDVITLSFSSNEDIQTPTVTIIGSATDVTVSQVGNVSTWTATKTVTSSHTQGTTAFTVSFSDLVGNAGTVTSSITTGKNVTIDRSVPTISTASIASNNANGSELAVPGDVITLTVVSNENIISPSITIANQSATIIAGADAENWSATYSMTENESNGPISFEIVFSDSAGNSGVDVTTITNDADGNNVTFDKSKPVLSSIAIVSDNLYSDAYARVGSIITLTFDSNEELLSSAFSITMNGVSRTPSRTASGTPESWAVSYTMTDATGDNSGSGYTIPFSIDYVDLNGYAGDQVTATSSGENVIFDKTAPTVSDLSFSTNNTNDGTLCKVDDIITVSLTTNEFIQIPAMSIASSGLTDETAGGTDASWTGTYTLTTGDTEGSIPISVDYEDYAGNSGITQTTTTGGEIITFDKTTPTLTAISISSNNKYSSSLAKTGDVVTISIIASETLQSSPIITISGDALSATGSGINWSASHTMQAGNTEGVIAFNISFEDLAANVGVPVIETIDASVVTFDKTATDMTDVGVDLNSGSDSGVSLTDNLTNDTTPTFTMTGLSTGDSLFLVIDGDTTARDKALSATLSLTSIALVDKVLGYSVAVVSRDASGNLSQASTLITVRIDTDSPSISSTPNLLESDDSGFYSNDNITNSIQPLLILAGLPSVRDSIRTFYDIGTGSVYCGAFRMGQATLDTVQVAIALDDNDYSFTYVLIDSAGNESSASTGLDVTIDATASSQPTKPNLLELYDSGVSNSDDLTNLSTIALNITSLTAGDSLFIQDSDGAIVASELLAGTSTNPTIYNATTSSYSAYVTDPAGNISLSSEGLSIVVDQNASDITNIGIDLKTDSDLGALTTDNLTNDFTPEFSISGLTISDSLYLLINGSINQRIVNTNTTMSITSDSLVDGSHNITIKSRDPAGNLSSVADTTLSIRIDTTPTILSAAPDLYYLDDNGFTSIDDITNIRQPRFVLSALPSDLDSIHFFINDGISNDLKIKTRMTTEFEETLTISVGNQLSHGNYAFSYTLIDSAGNTSIVSDTITISVDLVNPAEPNIPDLDLIDDTGESNSDDLTNLDRMDITTTGIDVGYARLLYKIDSTPDTTLIDSSLVPAEGFLTYAVANSVEGNYTFFAIAVDTAGNRSESSDYNVTVDFTIPSCIISFEGDSIVMMGDSETMATFLFSEEMDDVNVPTVDVDYPEGSTNDLTAQSLTFVNDSTWTYTIPLNTPGLETIDGIISLALTSSDRAGNVIPADSISGLSVLRVDNIIPAFSSFTPDTGSFINTLNNFGWTLSETIKLGSIKFKQKSGPGSDVSIVLDPTELVMGIHSPDSLVAGDPALDDGTLYDIIFIGEDTVGNIGNDTIANVLYDLTGPEATVTFSQLFVSADSTVTITATFNERAIPIPTISLNYSGNFNDIVDSPMTISNGDSSIWTYVATMPSGIENQGNVLVSIGAQDLASNNLDSTIMVDTLYVDNTVSTATFSYINSSQNDSLGNVGIGGDNLTITVQMNEPIVANEPIPTLNYSYGGGTGNIVEGVIAQSSSNADSVWVFNIELQDSIQNDGPLNISLVAKDRSNNFVTNYTNNTLFQVDNKHPEDFVVGDVSVYGKNPVQGWINGITDSIEVVIPIQTNAEDSTLFLGGYIQIQFYNLTRGTSWITLGTQDSISQSGIAESFFRSISEINTAMVPGSELQLGDVLEIRASITDRYGNSTNGTISSQQLVYDSSAPIIGTINGGNFFTNDTLFSNDTLSIKWSEFIDEGELASSGVDRYELAFEKVGTDSIEEFYGWDTVSLPVSPLSYGFFLMHNEKYLGHIRAFDIAGNISDTLVTDTLVRFNTKPTIGTLFDAGLDEDIAWTDTISLTDPDLTVLQGDSFTYKAITTRLIGDSATDSVSIDAMGVLSWTPTQNDTGSYEIQVIATDAYALADTFLLPLLVTAVNDTPIVAILSPDDIKEWEEDNSDSIKINLSSYLTDVDNNILTEMTWQYVILDTSQIDLDYPLGMVGIGPGTPWEVHARLTREYLGFNPNQRLLKAPSIAKGSVDRVNQSRASAPLLTVDIMEDEFGNSWAYFNSDSNYFGSEHRVIFIVQDLEGAESRDTIIAVITAQNDPPVISDLPNIEVIENDSIKLDFGLFTSDVDNPELTFSISAITNRDKITISPSTFLSQNIGDSVLFVPEKLWSKDASIQVIVSDEEFSDTSTFLLDVLRVERPNLSMAVIQNNAFSNFLQVIIVDTASMATSVSLDIQSGDIILDTIAAYTWSGDFNFNTSGTYAFDIYAKGVVGDTTVSETFALAAAKTNSRWMGRSYDGRFSVAGDPGTVQYDQSFLIVDSSLFAHNFNDRASYVFGVENYQFNDAVEITIGSHRNDLAIYRRKNGVIWEELPSLSRDGQIFTYSEKSGYFKLGPKTIIVPEETSIHQNYPNPFNPTTTIIYDIGLMDGLSQNVSINIFNLLGQQIKTLVRNKDQIGQFKIRWDGTDKFGNSLGSGIYFVQLTTNTGIVKNKKMMLLK